MKRKVSRGAGGVDAGQQKREPHNGAKAVRLGVSVHSQTPLTPRDRLNAYSNHNRVEMTPRAVAKMEEVWRLRREALHLLRLVIVEWDSDPQSVQCFDVRIVNRAKEVSRLIRELDPLDDI